jgi:hypothetical protein
MIIFEEEDDRFYIGESTIKGAGKGLFAKQKINKEEFLPITGVMVKRGSVGDQCTYFFNSYKFAANVKRKGDLIDIGEYVIVPLGYAGIVNHDEHRQNAEIRYVGDQHAQKSQHAGKAVYWFIRDVEEGEEIIGNYGNAWNGVLKRINEIHDKANHEKKDWEQFLEFNLYGIQDLVDN